MIRFFIFATALFLSIPALACVDEAYTLTVDEARKGVAVDQSELARYSCEALWEIRNAVFARHGYAFTTKRARDHFGQFDWYTRNESVSAETVEPLLTSTDNRNVGLVLVEEKTCMTRAELDTSMP